MKDDSHKANGKISLDGIGIWCSNLLSVNISTIFRFTVYCNIIIIVIRIDKCYTIK